MTAGSIPADGAEPRGSQESLVPVASSAVEAEPDWQDWPPEAKARYRWLLQARPDQLPPETDWLVWLILAGRGWGKTRTGAEWLADQAKNRPRSRWAIVAPTFADGRDTCVEGESGLLFCLAYIFKTWNRSMGELTLHNGSLIKVYSAEEPERLRGPQFHGAWCDELAAWNDAQSAWDQLQYGLRLGLRPQVAVTTTPRPIPIVRELLDRNAIATDIAITRGNTFDNAENLAPSALEALQRRYGGTRQGRQELYAEVLVDTPGALWNTEQLDKLRVEKAPELERVVVAIDPAVSSHEDSDETGIMVVGRGRNGEGYVLTDWSGRYSPDGWGRRAVELLAIHGGDRVVAEVNNGGDLVAHVLQTVDPNTPYRAVRASRGKRIRAEPVAALYEQGRVHHVGEAANLAELEKQLTGWSPEDKGDSPDRLDALVWGLWEVMGLESLGPVFLGAA